MHDFWDIEFLQEILASHGVFPSIQLEHYCSQGEVVLVS